MSKKFLKKVLEGVSVAARKITISALALLIAVPFGLWSVFLLDVNRAMAVELPVTIFSDNFDQSVSGLTNKWQTFSGASAPNRDNDDGDFNDVGVDGTKGLLIEGDDPSHTNDPDEGAERDIATKGYAILYVQYSRAFHNNANGEDDSFVAKYSLDGGVFQDIETITPIDTAPQVLSPVFPISNPDRHTKLTLRFYVNGTDNNDQVGVDDVVVTGENPPPFYDGFESNDFSTGGWTIEESPSFAHDDGNDNKAWTDNNGIAGHGSDTDGHAAELDESSGYSTNPDDAIVKSFDTTGYEDIYVRYARRTSGLNSSENLKTFYSVSVDGGGQPIWAQWESFRSDNYDSVSFALPSSADNNPNFKIRFEVNGSNSDDNAYIDDVVIWGTPMPSNQSPTITLNSPNGGEVWSGTYDITWTASDPDQGDILTITLQKNTDGQSWTDISTGEANDGTYLWDTTSVLDSVSYLIRAIVSDGILTAQDDSDAVFTVDNTPPTLTPVNIQSNNDQSNLAKVGDLITLNFTSDESLQAPIFGDIIIAGNPALVSGSGTSWTATTALTGSEDEGIILFTINYSDLAGNAGTQVISTTDGSSVLFDKSAPMTIVDTGVYVFGTWTSSDVIVTLSCDDNGGSGCVNTYYSVDGGDNFSLYEEPVIVSNEGSTAFGWYSIDNAGNGGIESYQSNYIRIDRTAPELSLPPDFTEEATSPGGAVVNYAASALDVVDGPVAVTCDPSSGSTFPITTTNVSCSATDTAGNTATGNFNVTVQDTTGPDIENYLDITAGATGPDGTIVDYIPPSATDLVDGSVEVACTLPSGSTFPIGTTLVTCTASDSRGNSSSKGFNIIVSDNDAPVLSLPSDFINEEATSPSGAVVNYEASAFDVVDGSVIATCDPISGFTFPFGTTPVSCSATDTVGNIARGSFNVTVQDTIPPSVPELSSPADGSEFNYSLTLSWLASTDLNGIKDYFVRAFLNDSEESYFEENTSDTSFDTSDVNDEEGLEDGTYKWQVKARDNADNESEWSDLWQFIKDTVRPIISLLTPSENSYHNSAISISGSATDEPVQTIKYVHLSYTNDGGENWTQIDTNSELGETQPLENTGPDPFNWSFLWTPTSDGAYGIRARAEDKAGNFSEIIQVNNVIYDTTAPTKPIADPIGGDFYNNVSVKITSSSTPADLSGLEGIYYTLDGTEPNASSTKYNSETPIALDKTTTIKAIAYDNAGNASEIMTEHYGIAPVISQETVVAVSVGENSATITWTTDDPSTSRVVYDTTSRPELGEAPNYGYANSTTETDLDPNKVTSHSVTITGLSAGTTYYVRTVSAGSPQIVSGQISFGTGSPAPSGGGGGGGGGNGPVSVGATFVPPSAPPAPSSGGGSASNSGSGGSSGQSVQGGGSVAPTQNLVQTTGGVSQTGGASVGHGTQSAGGAATENLNRISQATENAKPAGNAEQARGEQQTANISNGLPEQQPQSLFAALVSFGTRNTIPLVLAVLALFGGGYYFFAARLKKKF